MDNAERRDDLADLPKRRRFAFLWIALFALSGGLVAWIAALGLDRWPAGQLTTLPRIVALILFAAGSLAFLALLAGWAARRRRRAWLIPGIAVLVFTLGTAWGVRKVIRWRATIWMRDYLLQSREPYGPGTKDVVFCFVDHFEPGGIWNTPDTFPVERRMGRLKTWELAYQDAIDGHTDSDGRPPQHTWVFPIQHSVPEVASKLAGWPARGWGEIEYHLHHNGDWDDARVRRQILEDLAALREVGACTHGYAFVHGRYALAAGDPAECLVANELDLLKETGCYADFTFPNLGTPAQPSQVNSIFYARTTGMPKPHDRGHEVRFASSAHDGVLIVQGAMWMGFTMDVLDDSNLSVGQVPDTSRIDHWLSAHVHVRGQPNWIFIIVHSHSATEYAQDMLFRGNMQRLWGAMEARFKRPGWRLHYATTREVYNIIKAAEAGRAGNPDEYRDYLIPPPDNRLRAMPQGRRQDPRQSGARVNHMLLMAKQDHATQGDPVWRSLLHG